MRIDLDRLATGIMVVCAVVITMYTVLGTNRSRKDESAQKPRSITELDSSGITALRSITIGEPPADGSISLTEFIDLECPFCSKYASNAGFSEEAFGGHGCH